MYRGTLGFSSVGGLAKPEEYSQPCTTSSPPIVASFVSLYVTHITTVSHLAQLLLCRSLGSAMLRLHCAAVALLSPARPVPARRVIDTIAWGGVHHSFCFAAYSSPSPLIRSFTPLIRSHPCSYSPLARLPLAARSPLAFAARSLLAASAARWWVWGMSLSSMPGIHGSLRRCAHALFHPFS